MMEHEELFPLLLKIAKGNEDAFEKLYRATSAQLYAIALNMLRSQELAEEATQEAYVRIWYNADSYREGQGTVLTWMVSIVRYRALDMLRHTKVRKEQALEPEITASLVAQTESLVIDNSKLDRCLQALENPQRQAIHLAYFNGLSHAEVVQCLDTPLGTIKSWIRRGLQSLQKCLSI